MMEHNYRAKFPVIDILGRLSSVVRGDGTILYRYLNVITRIVLECTPDRRHVVELTQIHAATLLAVYNFTTDGTLRVPHFPHRDLQTTEVDRCLCISNPTNSVACCYVGSAASPVDHAFCRTRRKKLSYVDELDEVNINSTEVHLWSGSSRKSCSSTADTATADTSTAILNAEVDVEDNTKETCGNYDDTTPLLPLSKGVVRSRAPVTDRMIHQDLDIDTILRDMRVSLDVFTMRALTCALHTHRSGNTPVKLLAIVSAFVYTVTIQTRGIAVCTGSLGKAMWALPCRERYESSYIGIITCTMRLILSTALHNTPSMLRHFNPKYVNDRSLEMSPAMYYIYTMNIFSHDEGLPVFERYGPSETDVFLAAGHLLRGMSKYRCTFRGKTPKYMFPLEPGAVATGCLKVLKRNLSRENYLLVLLSLTLKICNTRYMVERGIMNVGNVLSFEQLLARMHRQLFKMSPACQGHRRSILGRITDIRLFDSPTISLATRYNLRNSRVFHTLSLVRSGHLRRLTVCPSMCSKLLMYADASRLRGESLFMLISMYWQIVVHDDNNYKCAYSPCHQTILVNIGKSLTGYDPHYSHLQIVLDQYREISANSEVHFLFDKVMSSNDATDLPCSEKIEMISRAILLGVKRIEATCALVKLRNQLIGEARDGVYMSKVKRQ